MIETEYKFTLPRGYVDDNGTLHCQGIMRLATAADEILPLRDPRVQQNPAYLTVITLSRVVLKLGDLPQVDTKIVERLFTADLMFLQDMYQRINQNDSPVFYAPCPHCGKEAEFPMNYFQGNS